MKRYLSLFTMVALTFSMAGCAPPKTTSTAEYGQNLPKDGGKQIIPVNPRKRDPFRTVVVDGVEMMEARGEIGQFGGTFYDNQIGDGPKTFNPWASMDATSTTMGEMMFAGLVTTDAYTGDVVPYLAKDVKISDDKLTYTVTLRKGLQWSDGKPITSKDVVFTWNEIVKPGFGNASNRDVVLVDGQFPQVRAIDDLTIEFKTAKPFAPFHRFLSQSIAPAHILQPVTAKGDKAFSSFWGVNDTKTPAKFVSSNMWILESYEPRQRVVFKRNPKFFMVDKKGQRLPYLDKYVISFVGDLNNQELQFEQNKVDSYGVPGNFVSHVRKLKKPAFRLYNLGPTSGTSFMAINLNTRKDANGKPYVDPVKAKWFNDVNFRQAINHTINREDIVSNILKGVGAPLYTAESLSSIFLNRDLAKGFPADPDFAKGLLKKSGFTWDSKGQLLDKDGKPVEFTLYTNSGNTEREAVGVNVKQDLAALGMKVNFKPVDFNVLIDKLNDGGWETIIISLTGSNLEPHGGANVWKSNGALHLFNKRKPDPNNANAVPKDRLPWEKELDEVFDKGAQVFEIADRAKYYNRYQEIVYEQAPMIYLYSPLSIIAVRERIQNFDPTPLGTFHNMEEIWIKE